MAKYNIRGLVVLVAIMAIGAIFTSTASANEIGRCATHHVNTGQELFESWNAEDVVGDSVPIIASAGYRHIDGDVHSWMRERVVKMKTAEAANFHDFGCSTSGSIFDAGVISFPKGTTIMAALPAKYDISDYCGIKAHKGCEKVVVTACAVGKVNCSNPLEDCAKMFFFVKKHHPHKPRHHHPRHHHHHKKPICRQGTVMIGNGCSPQTNNAKQECEVKSGYYWDSNTMVCVQVQQNGVCSAQSGVVNGNNNTVNQEVNCGSNTEICVNNSCNVTVEEKPCGCEPPEEEKPCGCVPKSEPPVVEWERIQEAYVNETRNLCVTATPTSVVSAVQFGVKEGERSNGGKGVYNASTNKYCVTYTAPSEEPSHVCEEEISSKLPPGTKCDVAHVAVFCNNGAKTVESKMEIPILDPVKNEEIVW